MTAQQKTPAEIYLVPDTEHGLVWSHDPAPGEGMKAEEAVKYVRADLAQSNEMLANRIVELTKERDALLSTAEHALNGAADNWLSGMTARTEANQLQCERAEMLKLIDELSTDLERKIKARYNGMLNYPSMKSKHDIDMDVVIRAKELSRSAKSSGTWLKDSNTHCNRAVVTLVGHLERQIAFSLKAFGPSKRTGGIIDHMKKELVEVAAAPDDLTEWIDLAMLALDGAWRHVDRTHLTLTQVAELVQKTLTEKLAKNEARSWPDWRTLSEDKAIEHNRNAVELAAKAGAV